MPWASSLTKPVAKTLQSSRSSTTGQMVLSTQGCPLGCQGHAILVHWLPQHISSEVHTPSLTAETSVLAAQHGPPRPGQVELPCAARNLLTWLLSPHSLARRLAPALGLLAPARHPPEHQQLPGCQRTAGLGRGPAQPQLPPPFQQSPGQQCSTCHWWLSLWRRPRSAGRHLAESAMHGRLSAGLCRHKLCADVGATMLGLDTGTAVAPGEVFHMQWSAPQACQNCLQAWVRKSLAKGRPRLGRCHGLLQSEICF